MTDVWVSTPRVQEVWESNTTPGVEWRTVYSEPSTGGGASLSNATPQALGTAAAGVATTASRADHVHTDPVPAHNSSGTAHADIRALITAAQGAGVWGLTRDAGLKLDYTRAEAPLGDVSAFPYFFDSAANGFLTGADGVTRCYQVAGASGSMAVSTVTEGNPLGAPYQSITVTGAPMSWVGGGPIVDLGGGEGLMILHVEDEYGPADGSWHYWTFGAAKVVDPGGGTAPTVTWLGSLFRHEMTPEFSETNDIAANLGSGHVLTFDGDVYLYHLDYDATGTAHGAVSRCSLTDIASAVDADEAPVFVKWNGEALGDPWTEPALGGESATNASLEIVADIGDMVELPDGRWLWMAARPGTPNQVEWSVGSTPLLWSPLSVLESDEVDDEWVYSLLWSGDPSSPRVLTRETAEFYFVAGTRWTDTRIDRVELRPVVSTDFAAGTTYLHTSGSVLDLADVPTSTEVVALAVATDTVVLPPAATWGGSITIDIYNGTGDPVTVTAAAGDIPIAGVGDLTIPASPGKAELFLVASVPLWSGVVDGGPATVDGSGFSTLSDTIDDVQEFAEAVDTALGSVGGGSTVGLIQPVQESGTTQYDLIPAVPTGSAATMALGAYTYYFPFVVQETITVDRLRCSVQTGAAAGKLLQMGIWEADGDFQPGAVVYKSSTIAADSTGEKTATPGTPLELTPGPYLIILASDGTPTMRYYPTQQPYLPLVSGTSFADSWHGWVRGGAPTLPLSDTPGVWNAAFGGGWGHNRCFVTLRVVP